MKKPLGGDEEGGYEDIGGNPKKGKFQQAEHEEDSKMTKRAAEEEEEKGVGIETDRTIESAEMTRPLSSREHHLTIDREGGKDTGGRKGEYSGHGTTGVPKGVSVGPGGHVHSEVLDHHQEMFGHNTERHGINRLKKG